MNQLHLKEKRKSKKVSTQYRKKKKGKQPCTGRHKEPATQEMDKGAKIKTIRPFRANQSWKNHVTS